jgi:succinate dehydrogenase / fumarate reductase membrane anchor subunit
MILAIIAMLYHLALGLQAVIEDYIHSEGWKIGVLIVVRVWCFLLALRGILAVVKLALA